MYAPLAYGAWFFVLQTIDIMCFRWHGLRPLAWQKQLIAHRFKAPQIDSQFRPFGTDKERAELQRAQALFPDRYMYLGAGCDYSPWQGNRWCHYVKVLVTDSKGTPPPTRYGGGGNCYGMPLERFLETEWVQQQQSCRNQALINSS